jgi:hypothetical protein
VTRVQHIHSTYKPDAGKKRHRQRGECEDGSIETSGAAERKRPRLQRKLKDRDFKVRADWKSVLKGRSGDSFSPTFVSVSAMDFDPSPDDDKRESGISTPELATDGKESGTSTPLSSVCNNTPDNIDPLLLKSAPVLGTSIRATVYDVIDINNLTGIDEGKSNLAKVV